MLHVPDPIQKMRRELCKNPNPNPHPARAAPLSTVLVSSGCCPIAGALRSTCSHADVKGRDSDSATLGSFADATAPAHVAFRNQKSYDRNDLCGE